MADTLLIQHLGLGRDYHFLNGSTDPTYFSKFGCEYVDGSFELTFYSGAKWYKFLLADITLQVGIAGAIEPFATFDALNQRLISIQYLGLVDSIVVFQKRPIAPRPDAWVFDLATQDDQVVITNAGNPNTYTLSDDGTQGWSNGDKLEIIAQGAEIHVLCANGLVFFGGDSTITDILIPDECRLELIRDSGQQWAAIMTGRNANNIVTTSAPSDAPNFIGQTYVDTNMKKVYTAIGISTSGDWEMLN